MAENIQRLVKIHKSVKRQASGVFQTVFMANFGGQFGVGAGLSG